MSTGTTNAPKPSSAKSSTSLGTKRKRGSEPKFYAVKVGMRPGIYYTWSDCYQQINGYKNAIFKTFTSLMEAETFIGGKESVKPTTSSKGPQKFYAVQNGRVPGVYTDWPSAQKQIVGWTRPKHKSFLTRNEAEAFVEAGQGGGSKVLASIEKQKTESQGSRRPSKRQNTKQKTPLEPDEQYYEPGEGPLPEDAEDGFDHRIFLNPETNKIEYKSEEQRKATKVRPSDEYLGEYIRIYTDGSSLGNGKKDAFAGVGVFFGPCDRRNVSEPLAGTRQTNQRAELTAIQRALGISPMHRSVEIYTDSSYAIKCVTEWGHNWRQNGWKTSAKKAVENKDLIEAIMEKIDKRDSLGVKTKLVWIKGHADDAGNVAADRLAVEGAKDNKALAEASGADFS